MWPEVQCASSCVFSWLKSVVLDAFMVLEEAEVGWRKAGFKGGFSGYVRLSHLSLLLLNVIKSTAPQKEIHIPTLDWGSGFSLRGGSGP